MDCGESPQRDSWIWRNDGHRNGDTAFKGGGRRRIYQCRRRLATDVWTRNFPVGYGPQVPTVPGEFKFAGNTFSLDSIGHIGPDKTMIVAVQLLWHCTVNCKRSRSHGSQVYGSANHWTASHVLIEHGNGRATDRFDDRRMSKERVHPQG